MKKQITLSVTEMNLVRAALEFAVEHVYDSQGEVDAFAWKAPADYNLMLAQEAGKLKTALMKMDYDEYVIRGQDYDEVK